MELFHVLVLVLASLTAAETKECIQGVNCVLPDCFCAGFSHPLGSKNIPQIVYFGFDDAVTPQVSTYFDELFTDNRLNPNGCPITMSLYVCHHYTKYPLVEGFFKRIDEIAVHSVTHTYISTAEKLRAEALAQKDNLIKEADIPGRDITGWRSPDLITAGDAQPRVLKELNFTYDISLPYESDHRIPFPFTLDYGYPYRCSIPPCPGKHSNHSGFWEVPINPLYDPVQGVYCTYVDGCRPRNENEAYEFLMTNFLRSYNGERSPFGLNMHAAWFYWPEYLKATHRFLDTVVNSYPDAYIISVQQMMAWMRDPQTTENSKFFAPWGCNWKGHKGHHKGQKETSRHDQKPSRYDDGSSSGLSPLRAWLAKYAENKATYQEYKNDRSKGSMLFRSIQNVH